MDTIIITTCKQTFLQSEFEYSFRLLLIWEDYKSFEKYMADMALSCDECHTYYWEQCKKRCNCK